MNQARIDSLDDGLTKLRDQVDALRPKTKGFPALERNLVRLDACLRMMELNIGKNFYLEPEELVAG